MNVMREYMFKMLGMSVAAIVAGLYAMKYMKFVPNMKTGFFAIIVYTLAAGIVFYVLGLLLIGGGNIQAAMKRATG